MSGIIEIATEPKKNPGEASFCLCPAEPILPSRPMPVLSRRAHSGGQERPLPAVARRLVLDGREHGGRM
jgi:hypothetical protein